MKKTFIVIILIVIVVLVAFFALNKDDGSADSTFSTVTNQESAITQALLDGEFSKTYRSEAHKFSVKYPEGLEASSFADESLGADVITIADPASGQGMQIIITPFDENIAVLTAERIKQDVPDLIIRDPQEVILGSSGKGVAFLDAEDDTANRQIWFIARQSLYQITAPVSSDTLVQKMLNNWVFE